MTDVVFRAATADDVAALHRLIESAYRGETAKAGWTHEADLLGGQRTDPAELTAILTDPARVLLLALTDGAITGCVQVADQGDGLSYLGMLTVQPTLQSAGLGRRLLDAAEATARDRFAATRMEMTVIRQRPELIAWYQRRGYAPTGETRPFPLHDARFGQAFRQDLEFVVLEKTLSQRERA